MNLFSKKILIVVISLGLVTFLLGLVLTAFVGDIFGEVSADHTTYSRSLVGHHALAELLRRTGIAVVVSRRSGRAGDRPDFPVLLLEPVPCMDARGSGRERSLEKILSQADEAGASVVLALPKRKVHPSRHPGWISVESLLDNPLEGIPPDVIDAESAGEEGPIRRPTSLRGIRGGPPGIEASAVDLEDPQVLDPGLVQQPLLWSESGVLIGRLPPRNNQGQVYVISDPDLFNNRGLDRGNHAVIIHDFIANTLGAEGVVIDESLHGFTSGSSLAARALSFPMVLIVIHGLLAAGLLAWSASQRFGKALAPPPELPPGKTLLLENTGKLLLSAGDHGAALRRYQQVTMAAAAERFYLPEGTSKRDLMAQMESLSKMRGLPFELDRIDRAARDRSLAPGEALKLARRIHVWYSALVRPLEASTRFPMPAAAGHPGPRSKGET